MPWWAWILLGVSLLSSEMLVDSGLYLLFLGIAGLFVGTAGLLGFEGEIWQEWLAFGLVSIVMLVSLRARTYSRLTEAPGIPPALIGEVGVAGEYIARGESGSTELRGSEWNARNIGERSIAQGTRVRVEDTDGLLLLVRAESESALEDR
jgi:membrane protein implicated in regulation of membrane protease activity